MFEPPQLFWELESAKSLPHGVVPRWVLGEVKIWTENIEFNLSNERSSWVRFQHQNVSTLYKLRCGRSCSKLRIWSFRSKHVWFRTRYLRRSLIYLCSLSRYRDGLRWSHLNINLIFERFRARYVSVFKGSCQIQKVLTLQLSIDRGVAELDRLCTWFMLTKKYAPLGSTKSVTAN